MTAPAGPAGPANRGRARAWTALGALACIAATPAVARSDAGPSGVQDLVEVTAPRAAPTPDERREAGVHYARAQRLERDGDPEGSLLELRHAYDLVPSPVVLLQIARAHARLDRPAEALAALDRLLASPGAVGASKLDEAQRLRAEQRARVARLRLALPTLDQLGVWLDGRAVAPHALAGEGKPVAPGRHFVAVAAPGALPSYLDVVLAPGETRDAAPELVPRPDGERIAPAAALVRTELPGADVLFDGVVVAGTPMPGPLPIAPGTRVVELRRPGYLRTSETIVVQPGETKTLELYPTVDPETPDELTGRIALDASEPDVAVVLNGVPRGTYRSPMRVPAGVHEVKVDRRGFEPATRTVLVPAGDDARVAVTLEPEPGTARSLERQAQKLRRRAFLLMGTGGVVTAAATVFLFDNAARIGDAQDRVDVLSAAGRRGHGGPCDPALPGVDLARCAADLEAAEDRLRSLELARVVGAVGLGLGAATVGLGIFTLLQTPTPSRYQPLEGDVPMARLQLVPRLAPGGGSLALVGRF